MSQDEPADALLDEEPLALLGKQRGVRPRGWREAAGAYGEEGVFRSVADVTDAESPAKVREYKKQLKAAARKQR